MHEEGINYSSGGEIEKTLFHTSDNLPCEVARLGDVAAMDVATPKLNPVLGTKRKRDRRHLVYSINTAFLMINPASETQIPSTGVYKIRLCVYVYVPLLPTHKPVVTGNTSVQQLTNAGRMACICFPTYDKALSYRQ